MMQVLGSELRAGDTIEVWWKPRRDTLLELRPYHGPLEHVFAQGASIARFALLSGGMTIDHGELFTVIARAALLKGSSDVV